MKKVLFLALTCIALFAKADFSEMSTEELIALIGYVDKSKEAKFYKELEKRLPNMNDLQKEIFNEDKQRRENGKN